MSWGNRVILILVLFVAGIMTMVYISMQQTNEVIDSNYYEKELAYQKIIDASQNLLNLPDTVAILQNEKDLVIEFPAEAVTDMESGKIELMRLSSSKSDKDFDIGNINNNIYHIPLATLQKGWYKMRMDWKSAGTLYYHEQNINIQ